MAMENVAMNLYQNQKNAEMWRQIDFLRLDNRVNSKVGDQL